jgi:hypothetical protein
VTDDRKPCPLDTDGDGDCAFCAHRGPGLIGYPGCVDGTIPVKPVDEPTTEDQWEIDFACEVLDHSVRFRRAGFLLGVFRSTVTVTANGMMNVSFVPHPPTFEQATVTVRMTRDDALFLSRTILDALEGGE